MPERRTNNSNRQRQVFYLTKSKTKSITRAGILLVVCITLLVARDDSFHARFASRYLRLAVSMREVVHQAVPYENLPSGELHQQYSDRGYVLSAPYGYVTTCFEPSNLLLATALLVSIQAFGQVNVIVYTDETLTARIPVGWKTRFGNLAVMVLSANETQTFRYTPSAVFGTFPVGVFLHPGSLVTKVATDFLQTLATFPHLISLAETFDPSQPLMWNALTKEAYRSCASCNEMGSRSMFSCLKDCVELYQSNNGLKDVVICPVLDDGRLLVDIYSSMGSSHWGGRYKQIEGPVSLYFLLGFLDFRESLDALSIVKAQSASSTSLPRAIFDGKLVTSAHTKNSACSVY